MLDGQSFAVFVQRIRAGDARATEELVRLYEPEIRREVRLRLRDPRLRRDFDSMDICQSVLGSFFVRVALGQYQLDQPDQLLKLLVSMTRNKLLYQIRKQRTQRRDHRRNEPAGQEKLAGVAAGASPSDVVAQAELLREFRARLNDEERRLADMRQQGREWAEVAAEVGGTPDSCRKQLERAIKRVSLELGLDEVDS